MNETQKHLLKLLQEIDDVCSAYGLRYYLAGGCFIGAFRHRGFLPWDDDADIVMPIDDVTKLMELSEQGMLPPNRTVINMEEYSSGLLWRYVDTTTTSFWRSTYPNKNHPHGQYIDIFVMYPGPDTDDERESFLRDYRLARNLETIYVVFQDLSREEIRTLKRRWNIRSKYLSWKHKPFESHRILYSDTWKDSSSYFISTQNKPEFEKRDYYNYPLRVPFENTSLCVYENAKEVLSIVFGSNWVEIPKTAGLRKPAHDIIQDLAFPYKRIIDDISSLNSFAVTRILDRGVKTASIKHWGERVDTLYPAYWHERKLRAREVNRIWEEANLDLDTIENTQDFNEVEYVLRRYYSIITWSRFTYWQFNIPVNDDVLWAAWYPKLQQGHYLQALKVLRSAKTDWDDSSQHIDARLKRLYEDCVDADVYMDAFWSREDYDTARSVVAKHSNDVHPSIVFVRGCLAMLEHDAKSQDDYKVLLEESRSARMSHPGDGELAYWEGCALFQLNRKQEAKHHLSHAADSSVNGIIRLMAQDLLARILEEKFDE